MSEDAWAEQLLAWAKAELRIDVCGERLGERVLGLVAAVPLILVLDGLERVRQGPGGSGYGRLLGGVLRAVPTGICRIRHASVAILTSRFVFAPRRCAVSSCRHASRRDRARSTHRR